MTERFERLAELFELCSDRTPEEVEAILDRECADDSELRAAVERLLASDAAPHTLHDVVDAVGRILDRASGAAATASHGPEFDPPTHVGRYAVTGILGYGGMGTVYSAEDPDLGRSVALKVLPGGWEDQPERYARFRREAQLLARLTHPNIAVLYSLEESQGCAFLTMEHIVGETLDERLRKLTPSLSETISWGRQIADALGVAHAKGVIHRDLKPSNVMISEGGALKVLDFGLAEVVAQPVDQATQIEVPPAGSPGYISPEQLRGEPATESADIWGWGCVLFECLSGRMAFPGADAEQRLRATLSHEPLDAAIPSSVPARLSQLVLDCLSPDPSRRPASVSLLQGRLREVSRRPDTRRRVRALGLLGVGAFALFLVAWFVRETGRGGPDAAESPALATSVTSHTPRRVTRSGFVESIDLSWSGDRIAYVTNHGDIVIVDVDGEAERTLVNDSSIQAVAWSPDGTKLLAYTLGRGVDRTVVVSTSDGTMEAIGPPGFQGRCWSSDGQRVLGPISKTRASQGPIFLLDLVTEQMSAVSLPHSLAHVEYDWSPASGRILIVGSYPGEGRGVWTLGGPDAEVVRGGGLNSDLALWSPGGESILVINRREGRSLLEYLPNPRMEAAPTSSLELPSSSISFRVSQDGTRIATLGQLPRSTVWRLVRSESTGEFEATAIWGGTMLAGDPKIRPDGDGVAFVSGDNESIGVLWVPIEGGDPVSLITGEMDVSFLSWSPGSERLAFGTVSGGRDGISWISAQGDERGTIEGVEGRTYVEWMPDGRILFHPHGSDSQNFRFVDPATGEQEPLFDPPRDGTLFQVAASHDGSRLAVAGARGGRSEIDVWLIRLGSEAEELLFEGAAAPIAWSPDDKWVYLAREIRESRFVGETVGEVFRVRVADRLVEPIASLPPGDLRRWTDVDVTSDGATIVCALSQDQRDVWVVDLPASSALR